MREVFSNDNGSLKHLPIVIWLVTPSEELVNDWYSKKDFSNLVVWCVFIQSLIAYIEAGKYISTNSN